MGCACRGPGACAGSDSPRSRNAISTPACRMSQAEITLASTGSHPLPPWPWATRLSPSGSGIPGSGSSCECLLAHQCQQRRCPDARVPSGQAVEVLAEAQGGDALALACPAEVPVNNSRWIRRIASRSEEHTSELQSLAYLVCRL